MKTTSVISATALMAWMFVGLSSGAQEPVAPATAADSNDAVATSAEPSTPVSTNSKVRIVRLSEVKGEVQLDRLTGKGFEGAMANLPVTEGARLKTGNGVAEVEFEDNSTIRVAQNSLVEFPKLEMLPSGAKSSAVNLLQGTVYVNLLNTKGNEFSVKFGLQTVNLPPDSHIRLQLTPTEANLAVMHGDVAVQEPSGTTIVGKNKTATFSAGQSEPMIAKSVAEQPLDSWDHDAVQYHKSYANATSFGNSPYAYGINDMNYYGSFINASGCGGGRCGGHTLPVPAGTRSGAAPGRITRARAIPGYLLTRGVGRRITTAAGTIATESAGVGSPAEPGSDWRITPS